MKIAEVNNFTKLSKDDQYKVIEVAMRNTNIKWNDLLASIYPHFNNKEFVSNLIQQFKQGSVKQSPATNKRPYEEVWQPKQDKVSAGLTKSSMELFNQMQAFTEAIKQQNMFPQDPILTMDPQIKGGEQKKRGYLNVNNITANFEKSSNKI